MQSLIQLPFDIQAVLVAGYLGYALYKRDHRKGERKADMLILMLVFGLPTGITLQLCDSPWAYLSVFIAPVLAGAWVKFGASWWQKRLQKHDISHNINEGNVWKTLGTAKGVFATQIVLYHKNGNRYMCADTYDFNVHQHSDAFAPYIIDEDGIAFYVTHSIVDNQQKWQEIPNVINDDSGNIITYFPKADIKFLDMRFIQPSSDKQ